MSKGKDKDRIPSTRAKDEEIKSVYRSEKRPGHLLGEDEQRQIRKEKELLVEQIQSGDVKGAITTLKRMGYTPASREYQALIALLYGDPKKR